MLCENVLQCESGKTMVLSRTQVITLDEAVLLGLLDLRCRSVSPAAPSGDADRPPSMSFTEALQKGYLDPLNATFHDPASGRTMKLDDAVIKGLIQPVLPSAAGDDPRYGQFLLSVSFP